MHDINKILEEVKENCSRFNPAVNIFTDEENTTMVCASLILEELRELKKEIQLIRGLQVHDHARFVNGNGERVDPGDLDDQPVWKWTRDYKGDRYLNCGRLWKEDPAAGEWV